MNSASKWAGRASAMVFCGSLGAVLGSAAANQIKVWRDRDAARALIAWEPKTSAANMRCRPVNEVHDQDIRIDQRCENGEVVCYTTGAGALSCRFKEPDSDDEAGTMTIEPDGTIKITPDAATKSKAPYDWMTPNTTPSHLGL